MKKQFFIHKVSTWIRFVLLIILLPGCESFPDRLLNGISLDPPYDVQVSTPALRLHQNLFIADLHADSLLWKENILKRHETGSVDIPRLIEGNIALQAFTVFTKIPLPYFRLFSKPWLEMYFTEPAPDVATLLAIWQLGDDRKRGNLKDRALYYAEVLTKAADNSNRQLTLIKTKLDLQNYIARRVSTPQITAGFLGLEGAHALEDDVNNVQEFFDKGYRMIGLVHWFDNAFAGSSAGLESVAGHLKPKGVELIKELGRKKIILDLSHASIQTIDDVLDLYDNPPFSPLPALIVSHTGVKGTCDRDGRNLHSRHIERIAQHHGLIGIGLYSSAVCGKGVEKSIDAIEHVVNVLGRTQGVESVALGSDFDGGVTTHFDASGMALVTQALKFRGFSDQEIRRVMGENVRDFLLNHLP